MSVHYIKDDNGKFKGSVGQGRDDVPQSAKQPRVDVAQPASAVVPLSECVDILTASTADTSEPKDYLRIQDGRKVFRQASDENRFTSSGGRCYWNGLENRCGRCDSRYCTKVCNAGVPGYVYVAGKGHIPFDQAEAIEKRWADAGLDYGPWHGLRRVDWRYEDVKPEASN